MYLKALEIQGFKSFPDKIRLTFEERVAAIVGPNGSGKSNISDAISWVMGGQRSKKLRGAKMEDVIFGGTAQRGKAGFAQVSLVLGNEDRSLKVDADEVMITRRYYRSGDSDYYINKKTVRLKDVNELLMDTGLGRDGYSLVGQGRVDEILSAKSTDRREIFEEAAGISKYRYNKEETERKLEKTGESLLRVGDKIAELELQVEPLRRQAETAKKYLLLRDELRGLEISLWMESLDKLSQRIRLLNDEYEETRSRLEGEKTALEQLYEESERCSEGIHRADQQAESLRSGISELETQAAAFASERAVLAADLKNHQEQVRRLEEEGGRQQEREQELSQRLEERRSRLAALEQELQALEEGQNALAADSEAASRAVRQAQAALEQLLASAGEADSQAAAAQARLEALSSSGDALQERQESLKAETARLQQRLEQEKAAREEARKKQESLQEARASAENVCRGYQMRTASRREKVQQLQESLRKAGVELSALRSRVSLLQDMEKEYEGFSRAVRTVMRESARGSLKNIHGTVAELIHTEDRYTVAIETALGSSLQSIVVEREEDGKAAIRYLKRTDGGRATFLPMSAVRGTELKKQELGNLPGVEGIASQLLDYDGRYRNVILSLLGRTVVAEDLDAAIALSRQNQGRLRIVTLDGQLINPGGSMTGGSAARNVGILSRANELQRLQQDAEALQEKAAQLEQELSGAEKELANADYAAETASLQLREAQDQLLKQEGECRQRDLLVQAAGEALESARREEKRSEEEAKDLQAARSAAAQERKRQQEAAQALRSRAAQDSSSLQQQEARAKTLEESMNRLRSEEASLQAEKSAVERAVAEWETLLSSFRLDREERLQLRESLLQQNGELETRMEALQEQAARRRSEAEAARPRLEKAMQERQDYEARRARSEREAQERNRSINELERQFAEVGQRKLSADMEEKQLVDKLWESYELSRSAAQRQRQELESSARAQKRVQQIRREMGSMGTPNLGAIDEFQRVNERYEFLTGQRDDIEKAKKELVDIVSGITDEMERIFAAEFEAVASSFRETFTELFGGGRGELVLEDPHDILNCGIEIQVQPPGKTLKNLTLLSGGERAFVAIALYFAMLKVRPAPFCVLDEIESALDEANVTRFARYTKRMSDKTQFLVITHRRGTMEEADMLYGVTMQKGISRVIPVELSEALKNT